MWCRYSNYSGGSHDYAIHLTPSFDQHHAPTNYSTQRPQIPTPLLPTHSNLTMTTKVRQLLDEAEHDDNENFSVAFWIQMAIFAALSHTNDKQSGSVPGKAGNIHQHYASAHMHYMLKYFWPQGDPRPGTTQLWPEQPESAFERRFRMPLRLLIGFAQLLSRVLLSCREECVQMLPDAWASRRY